MKMFTNDEISEKVSSFKQFDAKYLIVQTKISMKDRTHKPSNM